VVEQERQQHRAQAAAQRVGREPRVPWADGAAFVIENTDERVRQVAEFRLDGRAIRTPHRAGVGNRQMRKVWRVTWTRERSRNVQLKLGNVGHESVRLSSSLCIDAATFMWKCS